MDMDRYSIYIYKSGEILKIFEITPVACVYHGTLATLPMTEETELQSVIDYWVTARPRRHLFKPAV